MEKELTQIEKDRNTLEFYFKFYDSKIDSSKKAIKGRIKDALEMLELGECPDSEQIQEVYTEAHREHLNELRKEEAIKEYFASEQEHERAIKELHEKQSRLRFARINLVKVLGDEKATDLILRNSDKKQDAIK